MESSRISMIKLILGKWRMRVELLAQPPWGMHSVTFPNSWGDSPTLSTTKHVPTDLPDLEAEGNTLGTLASDPLGLGHML